MTDHKARRLVMSKALKVFEEEAIRLSFDWQEYVPGTKQPEDRYKADWRAYREFLDADRDIYPLAVKGDEQSFIRMLINRYKDSSHPVFIFYVQYLHRLLRNLPPDKIDQKKKRLEIKEASEELSKFLYLLMEVSPNVISNERVYLLGDRKKSSVTAFAKVLENRGLIKKYSDEVIARSLGRIIKGFSVSDKTVRTTYTNTSSDFVQQYIEILQRKKNS